MGSDPEGARRGGGARRGAGLGEGRGSERLWTRPVLPSPGSPGRQGPECITSRVSHPPRSLASSPSSGSPAIPHPTPHFSGPSGPLPLVSCDRIYSGAGPRCRFTSERDCAPSSCLQNPPTPVPCTSPVAGGSGRPHLPEPPWGKALSFPASASSLLVGCASLPSTRPELALLWEPLSDRRTPSLHTDPEPLGSQAPRGPSPACLPSSLRLPIVLDPGSWGLGGQGSACRGRGPADSPPVSGQR